MDKVKIWAGYLLCEVRTNIARKMVGNYSLQQLLEQLDYIPNAKVWEELNEEATKLNEELRQAGEYFHPGGSIFMDYKNLRDSVVPVGKEEMAKVVSRFRDDMTKDELMHTAEAIVSEWLSSTGKERKF